MWQAMTWTWYNFEELWNGIYKVQHFSSDQDMVILGVPDGCTELYQTKLLGTCPVVYGADATG